VHARGRATPGSVPSCGLPSFRGRPGLDRGELVVTDDRGLVYQFTVGQSFYLGLALVVSWLTLGRLFQFLPFTTEAQTRRLFFGPMCLVRGHEWADEQRYGVEGVCLTCRKQREVSSS
jgi:hypothetical protein